MTTTPHPIGSHLDGEAATAFIVRSFGYLHGAPPEAHVTVDVRDMLHNPHADPQMRDLTGLDPAVIVHVLNTPGALDLIRATVHLAVAVHGPLDRRGQLTIVAIGCAGGRHRSVVLANQVAQRIRYATGRPVDIEHYHVAAPVVQKP
jgi:RNase adaptor protein for sRNA GlmZ degradation